MLGQEQKVKIPMKKNLIIAIVILMIFENFGSSHILVLAYRLFSMDGTQYFSS